MIEINLFELESQFDDIMNRVELGEKFLVRMPDNEAVILTNVKDESIEFAERHGIINQLNLDK